MLKKLLRKAWWVFLLVIALGFFQERFKVALNRYIEQSQNHPEFFLWDTQEKTAFIEKSSPYIPYDYYYNHESFSLFHELSLSQLTALKWLATAIFIFLNGYFGWLIIKHLHWKQSKNFYLWLHVGVLILALLIYSNGILIGFRDEGYGAARRLVGFLQSPIPAIIVWFCFLGINRFQSDM